MLRVLLIRREATVRHLFSQQISQLCIYLSVFQVTRLSLLTLSLSGSYQPERGCLFREAHLLWLFIAPHDTSVQLYLRNKYLDMEHVVDVGSQFVLVVLLFGSSSVFFSLFFLEDMFGSADENMRGCSVVCWF